MKLLKQRNVANKKTRGAPSRSSCCGLKMCSYLTRSTFALPRHQSSSSSTVSRRTPTLNCVDGEFSELDVLVLPDTSVRLRLPDACRATLGRGAPEWMRPVFSMDHKALSIALSRKGAAATRFCWCRGEGVARSSSLRSPPREAHNREGANQGSDGPRRRRRGRKNQEKAGSVPHGHSRSEEHSFSNMPLRPTQRLALTGIVEEGKTDRRMASFRNR